MQGHSAFTPHVVFRACMRVCVCVGGGMMHDWRMCEWVERARQRVCKPWLLPSPLTHPLYLQWNARLRAELYPQGIVVGMMVRPG